MPPSAFGGLRFNVRNDGDNSVHKEDVDDEEEEQVDEQAHRDVNVTVTFGNGQQVNRTAPQRLPLARPPPAAVNDSDSSIECLE